MFCPCVKFNQFVFARTQPQLFRVLERGLPIGVRMDGMEVVVRVMDVVTLVFVTQQACRIDRCGVDRIRTCLIERDRVKGCKHADIRHDSHVVFRVAVAVGRHIDNQRNVEARTAVHDCFGVFRDFAVENDVGFIISASNRVGRAYADAAAAADALIVVDMCFFVRDGDGAVCADTCAHAAADARVLVHLRLACIVLLHLAGARTAAHADVFQAAAEAACLVALEVGQRDKHIRVHDGLSDFGLLDVFAALNRHIRFVRALQTVRDDDMAAGGER